MFRYLILVVFQVLVISSESFAVDFGAGVGTEFPLGLHGEATGSMDSFFAKVRYTMIAEPYIDTMNSISESADFYNSAISDILSEALGGGTSIELALGYSAGPKSGWRYEIFYSLIKGEGRVLGTTILAAVTNVTLPAGPNLYDIEGEIQNLGIRASFRKPVSENQVLDFSIGLLKPIDSETTIDRETTGPVQEAVLRAANRELDEYLNDTLKDEVFIPTLGITWGYSF